MAGGREKVEQGAGLLSGCPEDPYVVARRAKITVDTGPGLTKQSFADECDVNVIMERFARTGELPSDGKTAQYIDTTVMGDFARLQECTLRAREVFASLPAKVQARFKDDNEFIAFAAQMTDEQAAQILNAEVNPNVKGKLGDGSKGSGGTDRADSGRPDGQPDGSRRDSSVEAPKPGEAVNRS